MTNKPRISFNMPSSKHGYRIQSFPHPSMVMARSCSLYSLADFLIRTRKFSKRENKLPVRQDSLKQIPS